MSVAPIPLDEQARLESVRELWLLDTEPEDRFDRVTRMAQRIFDVPVAVFALVDSDRVWFKSQRGLDESELPRGEAICAHAILGETVLQVEDARRDPRFEESTLVRGPAGVVFYAGCPVSSPDHRRVGVLAIMDHRPRTLDPDDLRALADLAQGVERELAAARGSTVDEVTGLLNLRGFHLFAEKLLQISARSRSPLSLLYVDVLNLDPRATTRDREAMLKRVGEIISLTFRQSDVLARIGPARFCALLSEQAEHAAESAAARLQTAVRAWNMEPEKPFRLELAAAGARFDPEQPAGVDQLMGRADRAVTALRAVRQVGRQAR